MYQYLFVMHVLVSYFGSTPGVWVMTLQSAKFGATVDLVDNNMCSVRHDVRESDIRDELRFPFKLSLCYNPRSLFEAR